MGGGNAERNSPGREIGEPGTTREPQCEDTLVIWKLDPVAIRVAPDPALLQGGRKVVLARPVSEVHMRQD